MPWIEELSDPRELQRCVRDLVALSTLPAIWKDFDLKQIAESVAGALLSILNADFVHIACPGPADEPLIEITNAGKGIANGSVGAIRAALHKALPRPLLQRTLFDSRSARWRNALSCARPDRLWRRRDHRWRVASGRLSLTHAAALARNWRQQCDRRIAALAGRDRRAALRHADRAIAGPDWVLQPERAAAIHQSRRPKARRSQLADVAFRLNVFDLLAPGSASARATKYGHSSCEPGDGPASSPSTTSRPAQRCPFWSTRFASIIHVPGNRSTWRQSAVI